MTAKLCRRSACLWAVALAGCSSTEPDRHVAEGVVQVDPRAEQALARMCDTLKAADGLSFRAEVMIDEVRSMGEKVQYEGAVEVGLQRPSELIAELHGDVNAERIIYDGRTLTLLHTGEGLYASTAAPPTIDGALDEAAERFGLVIPFADLLYRDPGAVLSEDLLSGSYLGLHSVRGKPCHHVAFTTPDLAWQIWIDQGEPALPRKIVITYVHEVASPQYAGVFTSWNLSPTWGEGHFTFEPPEGAEQIELLEAARQ